MTHRSIPAPSRMVICVAVVALAWGPQAMFALAASAPEESVEAILMKAAENPGNLHAVRFAATVWNDLKAPMAEALRVKPQVLEHSMTYAFDRGKYRSDTICADVRNQTKAQKISLFDGETYQLFDPESRFLTRSTKPLAKDASLVPNPLLIPYSFLFQPGDAVLDYQTLRNPEVWKQAAREGQIIKTDRDDDHSYVVVRFPVKAPGERVWRDVYFAKEAGNYPLRMVMYRGGTERQHIVNVTTVDQYKTFETQTGKAVVPLHITSTDLLEGKPAQQINMQVSEESVAVNPEIAADVFSVPASQVRTILDADLKTQIPVGVGALDISNRDVASREAVSTAGRQANAGSSDPPVKTDPAPQALPLSVQDQRTWLDSRSALLIVLAAGVMVICGYMIWRKVVQRRIG